MRILIILILLFPINAWAYRMEKPVPINEINQNTLVELNDTLEELWNITNGRMAELLKVNVGNVNDGNYIEIQNDGDVVLHGTSRVTKYAWINASAVRAAGAAPADIAVNGNGFIVLAFDDGTDEYAQFNIKIPDDMDVSADSYLCVGWSANDQSDVVVWNYEYLITAQNESTDTAGTSGAINLTSSATADGLTVSNYATIAGGTITSSDVCLHIEVYRDANNGTDTLSGDMEVHGFALKYTANKLGEDQ